MRPVKVEMRHDSSLRELLMPPLFADDESDGVGDDDEEEDDNDDGGDDDNDDDGDDEEEEEEDEGCYEGYTQPGNPDTTSARRHLDHFWFLLM